MKEEGNLSLLRCLVIRFCDAIVRLGPNNRLFTLRRFPLGACGDASLLLGMYLEENGFGAATYVSGFRGRQSHAWVEIGDIFVDVAAGEFADAPEPIIVRRHSTWHRGFEDVQGHHADIDLYDERTRRNFLEAYDQIVANVEGY